MKGSSNMGAGLMLAWREWLEVGLIICMNLSIVEMLLSDRGDKMSYGQSERTENKVGHASIHFSVPNAQRILISPAVWIRAPSASRSHFLFLESNFKPCEMKYFSEVTLISHLVAGTAGMDSHGWISQNVKDWDLSRLVWSAFSADASS